MVKKACFFLLMLTLISCRRDVTIEEDVSYKQVTYQVAKEHIAELIPLVARILNWEMVKEDLDSGYFTLQTPATKVGGVSRIVVKLTPTEGGCQVKTSSSTIEEGFFVVTDPTNVKKLFQTLEELLGKEHLLSQKAIKNPSKKEGFKH